MSMTLCICSGFIDTDTDPDSTYFDDGFRCESCRENMTEAEHEEHQKRMGA